MAFLKKLLSAISDSTKVEVPTVVFDQDWQDSIATLKSKFEGSRAPDSMNVSFPDELLQELCDAIESHQPSSRIPYAEAKVPINNVGESFRQDGLARLCGGKPGEEMDWLAGFLLPELLNPYDKNAVAVYAISKEISMNSEDSPYAIAHVGYMDKESAAKVHKKILNLLGKDQYVPLLIRMTGGTTEKPNYGAFPYAMTEAIKFPQI
jgi:hypothetical protein